MDTDLRFALLPQTSQHIARCLAQAPIVRRRKAEQEQVHNRYGDPQCVVTFERTRWLVNLQTSRVAITLDVGELEADGERMPICELTLKLQTGDADAVYAVARQISQTLSLLPLQGSKRERGYHVAQRAQYAVLRAVTVELKPHMTLLQVAAATLREMFLQFTVNLRNLRDSDEPELVHQARIGWRRFKSLLQLYKKYPGVPSPPTPVPLQALWSAMAELRDLEVALAQTLPMFANAYTGGDVARRQQWQAMERTLANAVVDQRTRVQDALAAPAVGANLIEWMQWLALLAAGEPSGSDNGSAPVGAWLRERMLRLHKQLVQETPHTTDPAVQHRIRILSKRLRYCVEALRPLLPKGRSKRWLQVATSLQENIGAVRDMACAVDIVSGLEVDPAIVHFLRGVAFGQRMYSR